MGRKLDPLPSVSYTSRCKSIARRYDRRVVMRPDCLLYMDRKMMLLKMAGNAKTVLRKTTNASTGRPHTVNDVLQEYWKTEKKNLMAMIRQFGIPTLFITLSAAESKWTELLAMLKKIVDNDPITPAQAEKLTPRERAWLVQSDPVTCASYFDYRFREMKKTWTAPCADGHFLGLNVQEYFFRTEFQHRGSPHIHMMIWLEDAPRILPGSTENDARVCQFVDGIITCEKEWDGSPHTYDSNSTEATWDDIICRQTHKHTATCKRKRGDQIVCRFDIPFLPMDVTRVLRPFNADEGK